ncbi:hypothetical protein CBS147355_9723 [Penicillium roqueforti]|nr:hypothetical protein CBS147355_9723 [Penicillium roqueforti]KAI3244104.1 hypothetical protein CBS147309_9719 [Penicillium roqueforti]
MVGRLKNKVCLVTGTGGSMGRAAALKFTMEGALIVGCDSNEANDKETVEAVKRAGGKMVSYAPIDLTSRENCVKLIEFTIEKYGRIDCLYNNASMAYFGWMDDITDEAWHKTIRMELDIVYLLTKIAWPHLKASGASIINVGSVNGWVGLAVLPAIAHTAAKGGVIAMTRQLAMEGRTHGIRANTISPGVIESLQTKPLLEDPVWKKTMLDKIMLGRLGRADEIANVASFLASDESSYITGSDILVDGGLTAW